MHTTFSTRRLLSRKISNSLVYRYSVHCTQAQSVQKHSCRCYTHRCRCTLRSAHVVCYLERSQTPSSTDIQYTALMAQSVSHLDELTHHRSNADIRCGSTIMEHADHPQHISAILRLLSIADLKLPQSTDIQPYCTHGTGQTIASSIHRMITRRQASCEFT